MKKYLLGLVILIAVLAAAVVLLPMLSPQEKYSWEYAKGHLAPGKFVQTGVNATHYIVKGEGPPVILIHGFLYSTFMWKDVTDLLSKKFTVYAVDLLGWGYSQRLAAGDYTYRLYSDQIHQFMDALGIRKASLVGQSMGGGTAILFGTLHPDRVEKLILVDAAGLPNPLALTGRIFALPFLGEFLLSLPRRAVLASNIKQLWFYDPSKVTREYIAEVERPLMIEGSGRTILDILRHLDFGSLSAEIRTLGGTVKPILILWGREDRAIPLPIGEEMHKIFTGSELKIIEKAGHTPHEEHPEEAARLMTEFLLK